jgi:excisionase family DNA binding protein
MKEDSPMSSAQKAADRKTYQPPPPGRISLSVAEVCGLTGIGMTKLRAVINTGLLPSRRLGKKIIIRRVDVDNFLKGLPTDSLKRNDQNGTAET